MAKKTQRKTPVEQQPTQVVTELELVAVETSRMTLATLRKRVREAEATLEQQEADVIAKVRAGAAIQGKLAASVTVEMGPSRPKWQELHFEHMLNEHGLTKEQVVVDAQKRYPPKPYDVLNITPALPTV